jgi:hypothetical protein
MSILVRPISANLTRDTEAFERMVNPILFRTHTSKSTSVEDVLSGMIASPSTLAQIPPSESKSGITIPSRMIWSEKECITS